ncbi:3-oxoacyl-ACP synthase III family protein [Clostridium sediminicola]|uniref:3-oxoacyl-[acyl-carrier-protein] synthase III C-terminal domain-containing protein n=1 Tax=Clostridium sediminicola TaxID=3114879 RepID=UPI0031F21A2A
MFNNIIIKGIGIYHPENIVENEFFVDHFSKIGINIEENLRGMGREKRYLSNIDGETVITMGKEASLKALKEADVIPEDIDMLIFATDSPEYTCPTNALLLNSELGATNAGLTFDINTNCTGMLYAIDVACKMMKGSESIKKVLIVGSLLASLIACEKDPAIYANFADSAAALVLESVEENTERGFIDSACVTNAFVKDGFMMPKKGFSQIYNDDIEVHDKKFQLNPFDASFVPEEWVKLINKLLENNNYKADDIKQFLFSQYAKQMGEGTLDMLGLSTDFLTYVGHIYGYTGVTSPILAYYHALEENKIKNGDNIIFCSVGAGFNAMANLYKQ